MKLNQVDLRYIKKLKKIFPNNLVGYSDHTNISTCIAAVALGLKLLKNILLFREMMELQIVFFSLEENDLKKMVDGIREVEQSLGVTKKVIYNSIYQMQKGRRSYYSQRNLKREK